MFKCGHIKSIISAKYDDGAMDSLEVYNNIDINYDNAKLTQNRKEKLISFKCLFRIINLKIFSLKNLNIFSLLSSSSNVFKQLPDSISQTFIVLSSEQLIILLFYI